MAQRNLGSLASARRNRFRSRGLGAAATALAASGAADSASAAIIYDLNANTSNPNSLMLNGLPAAETELFSMNGMNGLNVGLRAPGGMGSSSTLDFSVLVVGMGMGAVRWLDEMNAGESVGAGLTYRGSSFLVRNDTDHPTWLANQTHYAGFRFDPGGGEPTYYGWMHVQFSADGQNATLLEWAYDDTGAPIEVASIAEPGLALLLGLGFAGIAAHWKWRGFAALRSTD